MTQWSPQQEAALKAVSDWLRAHKAGSAPQCFRVFGFAGSGKTTIARHLAEGVDGIVLFGAFTGKAALVLRNKGCPNATTIHSMIYAVQEGYGGVPEFVISPTSPAHEASLIIIDECFVPGTLVDTPAGPVPIERLRPGDEILNASGLDHVVAIGKREAVDVIKINAGGKEILCSGNHPFFTVRGLILARNLRSGDTLLPTGESMRLLRNNLHPQGQGASSLLLTSLLDAMVSPIRGGARANVHESPCEKFWRGSVPVSEVWKHSCKEADRSDQNSNPLNEAGCPEEDKSKITEHGAPSTGSRWKWQTYAEAAGWLAERIGGRMGTRVRRPHRNGEGWLSSLLQNRRGKPITQNSDRGGWQFSRTSEAPRGRPEEGSVSSWPRVESVEAIELRSHELDRYRDGAGKLYLYDIQAARHQSFSVHGNLVHNCSMVDEELGRDLLSFGKPVLVLGDPAQLPPVRGEGFFTNHEPDVMLTEIHRQALDNPIIALSQKVREGGAIERGDYGAVRVVQRNSLATEDVLDVDQVLVGRNITRRNFNKWFRRILERPDPVNPVPGDKLVCLRNKHHKGLLNGGLWEVVELKEKAKRGRRKAIDLFAGGLRHMIVRPLDEGVGDCGVEITVPGAFFIGSEHELHWKERRRYDEFDFGYALTVHKSQGSQWDNVMVFDESAVFREDRNRHLYTAITRAAERLTIVQS